jgi:hypothetical protein
MRPRPAQGRQGRGRHHPRFAHHALRHSPRGLGLQARQPLRAGVDSGSAQGKETEGPTIREKFDTYRFADYKEKVIDLLMRVTRVSVETQRITAAMRTAKR